jgi:hypothetical protein
MMVRPQTQISIGLSIVRRSPFSTALTTISAAFSEAFSAVECTADETLSSRDFKADIASGCTDNSRCYECLWGRA